MIKVISIGVHEGQSILEVVGGFHGGKIILLYGDDARLHTQALNPVPDLVQGAGWGHKDNAVEGGFAVVGRKCEVAASCRQPEAYAACTNQSKVLVQMRLTSEQVSWKHAFIGESLQSQFQ